jgi:hypothetical protein
MKAVQLRSTYLLLRVAKYAVAKGYTKRKKS